MTLPSETEADPRPELPLDPPTSVRWQIVGLIAGYSLMSWFNRVCMAVAYTTRIKHEYAGITDTEMGSVHMAMLVAYTVLMTPGGWLIDWAGPKTALVLMGFGSALFVMLTGVPGYLALNVTGLIAALFVVRGLMGACSAPIYPAGSRLVSHWLPWRQHTLGNGLIQAAAPLGMAAAFPLFGRLIDAVDWPPAFLMAGGLTAALALLWTLFGTDYARQHPLVNEAERRLIERSAPVPRLAGNASADGDVAPVRWTALLRNRSLLLLTVSYAAVGYVEYFYFFWVEHYFEEVLKLGKDSSRVFASVLFLSMAAGMVLGGWLSGRLEVAVGKRQGRIIVPMVGMVAGPVLLLLGGLATEAAWVVTLLSLSLVAVGAVEAPVWTTAVELGGRHGGTAAGICNTGGNIGGFLAPFVTPLVADRVGAYYGSDLVGWQCGIALGAGIGLAGAVLWLWITPADSAGA
jgi:ACS family glucarate transporter-like MFS transporter